MFLSTVYVIRQRSGQRVVFFLQDHGYTLKNTDMTFSIDHSSGKLSIVYPHQIKLTLQLSKIRYYPAVHLFFELMSNSLVLHRKNASALSSPDKNLITKELVVLFSF